MGRVAEVPVRHVEGEEQLEVVLFGMIEREVNGVVAPVCKLVEVEGEGIDAESLCVKDVLANVLFQHASDHVVDEDWLARCRAG